MELIDTHCHLQFDAFISHEDKILADAASSGVTRVICVGTDLADSKTAVELARAKKNVWAAVGVHPHEAERYLAEPKADRKLAALLAESKVVAIGEIGLDFYRQRSTEAHQEAALRNQVEIGLKSGLPFIFHVRDAWRDFWRIIDDYQVKNAVVHSFSSGAKQLDQILNRGFYVGLNGIMTFTKDEAQLAAAKTVPLDRLVLETDAPFLTPEPFRGQTCEPKHVRATAEFLARLRGEELEELSAATTANAIRIFGLK